MFFSTVERRGYLRMIVELVLLAVIIFILGSLLTAGGQTPSNSPDIGVRTVSDANPVYREYRGVSIGMTADEARRKLGEPADKSDQQDFYNFSDTESAQIFYDATRRVLAVSVHYVGLGQAPIPAVVFGEDAQPRPDGSIYKLVKYTRAGYWVSYSRTAGNAPLITVSMQKSK